MMRKFCSIAASLLLVFLMVTSASAESLAEGSKRVFDEGNLFTKSQMDELQEMIDEFRKKFYVDIVIVTSDEILSYQAEAAADDFYDYNGFGVGENFDGILLLISVHRYSDEGMQKYVHISTTGSMIPMMSDARIERMLDEFTFNMKQQNFFGVAKHFIKKTTSCIKTGIPNGWFDLQVKHISTSLVVIASIVAFLIASFVRFSIKSSYKMTRKAYVYPYKEKSAFNLTVEQDIFNDEYVTSRTITHSDSGSGGGSSGGSSSSTHSSSSGSSHGGGGRSY